MEIFPLIYCKYADFFIQNLNVLTGQKIPLLSIAMPLGISFYTFQVISYTVDVYRGDVPAQKNLLTFAAYVAMFPQLVAGPIVRYSDIRSQLENRMHSVEKCAYGIRRFVTGLSKKNTDCKCTRGADRTVSGFRGKIGFIFLDVCGSVYASDLL